MVEPLTFTYRNWRGETAPRRVMPISVRFGATDWHPEPQWLLLALDLDKGAEREFAMADMSVSCLATPPADTATGAAEAWPTDPETGLRDMSLATLLREARKEGEMAEREACAALAEAYPAHQHGHLDADPHYAAQQAAHEIGGAIRARSTIAQGGGDGG